jgi:hypothetical protein
MKQLLTVSEENVMRFRHECFLTKNLSHPNVVKLVGVCWSDDLFACCLEFVENGSLEDWLRRTVGGKVYEADKKAVKKVTSKEGATGSEAETVEKGFDLSLYDESKHTEMDRTKLEEGRALVKSTWAECSAGEEQGWKPMLKEDGSPLDEGCTGYQIYDKEARQGLSIGRIVVDAAPAQVVARYGRAKRVQRSARPARKASTVEADYGVLPGGDPPTPPCGWRGRRGWRSVSQWGAPN